MKTVTALKGHSDQLSAQVDTFIQQIRQASLG